MGQANRNGWYISAVLKLEVFIPVPVYIPSCKVHQTHLNQLIRFSRNRNEHPGLWQIGGKTRVSVPVKSKCLGLKLHFWFAQIPWVSLWVTFCLITCPPFWIWWNSFLIGTSANFAQSSKLGQMISRPNHTKVNEWIFDLLSHSPINL